MVNKSKSKKKTCSCKHLCIECKHIMESTDDKPKCYASGKEKIDCVDGEKYTEYKYCEQLNKHGQCKKWKLDQDKFDEKQLLALLKKYQDKQNANYDCSWSIGEYLAWQLSLFLQYPKADDLVFFKDYDEDDEESNIYYKYNPDEGYKVKTKRYKKYLKKQS